MEQSYDLIVVGTGFAGTFFLKRYLERAPARAKVLVLERGAEDSKAWQLEHRRASSIDADTIMRNVTATPRAEWMVHPGLGGNSKCWFGGATRMMPGDFELKSRYGVGQDWPMRYADLEPYYCEAEAVMQISGPDDSPMPRSRPFQLPSHRFSGPDELLKKHFPDGWFHAATARASVATATRGACCASGVCELCPVDAKFTIQNGLAHLYRDPRVTLQLQATVKQVDTSANVARGVSWVHEGQPQSATADLVVLGASGVFNPHILARSSINHPLLGKGLHKERAVELLLDLGGTKANNGSSLVTGLGYMFYEGAHRRDHAACLVELVNSPYVYYPGSLRRDKGRWNERVQINFLFDELPRLDNTVSVAADNPDIAEIRFNGYTDYAQRGAAQVPRLLDTLAQALPIERVVKVMDGTMSGHIYGTVVMGRDPQTSIVDGNLVHHQYRNLLVLGSSAYPTASPAYPTLTIAALSLWAADHVLPART